MPLGRRPAANGATNSRAALGSAADQAGSFSRGIARFAREGDPTGHVFHITERSAFSAALEAGSYEADTLGSEGFIHCSTREQVLRTASRFYGGRSGLVLLCIDAALLGAALRFEPADGELFPHCYGKIPLEAIVAALDFPAQSDGSFVLPDELSVFAEPVTGG